MTAAARLTDYLLILENVYRIDNTDFGRKHYTQPAQKMQLDSKKRRAENERPPLPRFRKQDYRGYCNIRKRFYMTVRLMPAPVPLHSEAPEFLRP